MTTNESLYRLMSWLSPAYPVGAYAFSHGIEYAVQAEWVTDADSARDWIATIVEHGSGFADLVFLAEAWRRVDDADELLSLNELALAFQTTAELRTESTAEGRAFVAVTRDAWYCDAIKVFERIPTKECVYAVVVGAIASSHGVARDDVTYAYAQAFAANLVSAAVRLIPLGQTDGQRITADLMPICASAVQRALSTPVDEVSTSTPMVDIASMNHETQYTRLFRS